MRNIKKFNIYKIPFFTDVFYEFKIFTWNEQTYTTKEYSTKLKTNHSAVKLNDNNYGEIIKIFKSNDDDGIIYLIVDVLNIDKNHISVLKLCNN